MARLTLATPIAALSGKISNSYLRRIRTITFLVKPPCDISKPSAKQVAHRLAWWRSEQIRLQVPSFYNPTFNYLAGVAGVGQRQHWLHTHVSAESAAGYAPLVPACDKCPPVENLTNLGCHYAGRVWLTYDPLPAWPPYLVGWTCRHVPAPGEPASHLFAQHAYPTQSATIGVIDITGLQAHTLYSFSIHFMHDLLYWFGPSSILTEIEAGPV